MLSKVLNAYSSRSSADEQSGLTGEEVYAPNTEIPYKPSLIQELKQENRTILAGFKLLKEKIKLNDIETSREVLVELKRALLDHFIKENISLYVYIKALNQGNHDKNCLLKELKREMDGVQAMMFMFFSTYLNTELTADELYALGEELNVIGKVMRWRIKREEKELYPLYIAPPAAWTTASPLHRRIKWSDHLILLF